MRAAVERLKEAGAEKVVIHFSGTDDSGGITDLEVEPREALERLQEAGFWEGVREALGDEAWDLFEGFAIGFNDSGSAGHIVLDLKEGQILMEWWGHRQSVSVGPAEFETDLEKELPFRGPEGRVRFRVRDGKVVVEGEFPQETLKDLAEAVRGLLEEALEDAAWEEYALPDETEVTLLEGSGEVLLDGETLLVRGRVRGTVVVEEDWEWEEDETSARYWEAPLEDHLRERTLKELTD